MEKNDDFMLRFLIELNKLNDAQKIEFMFKLEIHRISTDIKSRLNEMLETLSTLESLEKRNNFERGQNLEIRRLKTALKAYAEDLDSRLIPEFHSLSYTFIPSTLQSFRSSYQDENFYECIIAHLTKEQDENFYEFIIAHLTKEEEFQNSFQAIEGTVDSLAVRVRNLVEDVLGDESS